jgi:glycosyltransferase 2 family protein
MRKFILAIALLFGIIFLFSRFTEIQNVAETLQRGVIWFIIAAILIEAFWYINVAASYRYIYQSLGMEEKISRLVMLSLGAYFVNVVAPSVGMSGIAVFVGDAPFRKHSSAKVTVAGALFVLFDYIGFLFVLILGLAVLARRNKLEWPEISASVIIVLIALFLTGLLYLGAKSASLLGKFLAWLARKINRIMNPFIHRQYLSEERAHSFAKEAAEGVHALRSRPRNWIRPLLLALSNKALLVTILMMVFLAFKVPFSAGTIIAGFSIGYLFLIVSPTPSGIGIVEGVLTLTLTSLRVRLEDAAVIVLAYRGITFWIPLFFGLAAFRILPRTRVSGHNDQVNP